MVKIGEWLQAAGIEDINSERGLYFDDTAAGVASAIGGACYWPDAQ